MISTWNVKIVIGFTSKRCTWNWFNHRWKHRVGSRDPIGLNCPFRNIEHLLRVWQHWRCMYSGQRRGGIIFWNAECGCFNLIIIMINLSAFGHDSVLVLSRWMTSVYNLDQHYQLISNFVNKLTQLSSLRTKLLRQVLFSLLWGWYINILSFQTVDINFVYYFNVWTKAMTAAKGQIASIREACLSPRSQL